MARLQFKGEPVSGGIGIGKICILQGKHCEVNEGLISSGTVDAEITRLDLAIEKVVKDIYSLREDLNEGLEKQGELILDVYTAVLQDIYFIDEIKNLIRVKRLYADNAVHICFKEYIKSVEDSENEYAKQRVYDLNDIRCRIIDYIEGDGSRTLLDKIYRKQIVVVRELTPSLAMAVGKRKVMGVAACDGAPYFSHAAIVLRSFGIPALNGIDFDTIVGYDEQQAIIDASTGFLTVNPEKGEVVSGRSILKKTLSQQKLLMKNKNKMPITKDGCRINVSANIGSIYEFNTARSNNVDGIGLVRTEILFANNEQEPDELEQFVIYSKIVKRMRNKPVIIRTADIGGDKIPLYATLHGGVLNQALQSSDLRGISRSLEEQGRFVTQVKAIIRSAQYGNVGITFPMVDSATQIRAAKGIIEKVRHELWLYGRTAGDEISIGAVIETEKGLKDLDSILQEVDFISVGTNDLFEQTMGGSRETSREQEYLEPGFLSKVGHCIKKARAAGKFVSVCGEMAADEKVLVMLVGMGAEDLSVPPSMALKIKNIIRDISMYEARQLAKITVECSTLDEVKFILTQWENNRK